MAYKMIQVGTGGQGEAWCRRDLPPVIKEGLVEPVAAVDTNPEALVNAIAQRGNDLTRVKPLQTPLIELLKRPI